MFLDSPSHPWVSLKIALTISTQPAQSTRRLGNSASRPQRLAWPPTAQSHVLVDFPFDSTVIFLGILDSTGDLTVVLQSLVSWFLLFQQLTSCWIAACHTVVVQSCELGAVIAPNPPRWHRRSLHSDFETRTSPSRICLNLPLDGGAPCFHFKPNTTANSVLPDALTC